MPAKFVLKKGSTGKFRFNLLATNGQVIATSEAYESKAAAMRGIQSVQKNAAGATVDDQTSGTGSAGASKTTARKTTAKKTTGTTRSTAKRTTAKKASARKSSARKTTSGSDAGDGSGERADQNQQDGGEHVYDTVELQLGTCHYGGLDEDATLMATREDGTGWIAICEEHRQQAEQDGFVVNEDA